MKSLVSIMDKDNRCIKHSNITLMGLSGILSLYIRHAYPVILKPSAIYDITDMKDLNRDNTHIRDFCKMVCDIYKSIGFCDNNLKFLVNNNSKLVLNNSSELTINEIVYNYKNDNTSMIKGIESDSRDNPINLYKQMYLHDRYDISSTVNIIASNMLSNNSKRFTKYMLTYIDTIYHSNNFTYDIINNIINFTKTMETNTYCKILGFIIFVSVNDNASIQALETLLRLEKKEYILEQFSDMIGIATRMTSTDIESRYCYQVNFKEFYNSIIDTYNKCIAKNITLKTKSGIAYIVLEHILNQSILNIFTSTASDFDRRVSIHDAIPDYTTRSVSLSDGISRGEVDNENDSMIVSFSQDTETINKMLGLIDIILELGEYNFDMLFDSFAVTGLTSYWTNTHLSSYTLNFFITTCCNSYYTSNTIKNNNLIKIIEHLISKGYEPYNHTTIKILASCNIGDDNDDNDEDFDDTFNEEEYENQKIVNVANPKVTNLNYILFNQECNAFSMNHIPIFYNNQRSIIPASEILKNNVTMFEYMVKYLTNISEKNPKAFNTIKNITKMMNYISNLLKLDGDNYSVYAYDMIDTYDTYNCKSKIIELVEKLLSLFSKDLINCLTDADLYMNDEGIVSDSYYRMLGEIGSILVVHRRRAPICSDIITAIQSTIIKIFGEIVCMWSIRIVLSGYCGYYSSHDNNIIYCKNLSHRDSFVKFVNGVHIDIESTSHEILLTDNPAIDKLIDTMGLVGIKHGDNRNMYRTDDSGIDKDFNNPVVTNFDVNLNLTFSLITLAKHTSYNRNPVYRSFYCSNAFLNIQQKLLRSIFRSVNRILSVFPTSQQEFIVSPKSYFMNGITFGDPLSYLDCEYTNGLFIPSKDKVHINAKHIHRKDFKVWFYIHNGPLEDSSERICIIIYIAMIIYGLNHNYITIEESKELLLVSVLRCWRMYGDVRNSMNVNINHGSADINVNIDYDQSMQNYINRVTCVDKYVETTLAHILFRYMIDKLNIVDIDRIVRDSIDGVNRHMVYDDANYDGPLLDVETFNGISIEENFNQFISTYDKDSYNLIYSNIDQFFKDHDEYLPIQLRS